MRLIGLLVGLTLMVILMAGCGGATTPAPTVAATPDRADAKLHPCSYCRSHGHQHSRHRPADAHQHSGADTDAGHAHACPPDTRAYPQSLPSHHHG